MKIELTTTDTVSGELALGGVKPGHRYVVVRNADPDADDYGELLALDPHDFENPEHEGHATFVQVKTGEMVWAEPGDLFAPPIRHRADSHRLIIDGDQQTIRALLHKAWNITPGGSQEEAEVGALLEKFGS